MLRQILMGDSEFTRFGELIILGSARYSLIKGTFIVNKDGTATIDVP